MSPPAALPAAEGRRGAGRRDVLPLAAMAAVVLALNVVGWGVLLLAVVPARLDLGAQGVFGAGLGVTAFLLGVRHAFDADHVAVIDNATRKLVGEGRRALGVGFWFSLGHSSVVFALALALAVGVRALAGPVQDEDSALQQTLGTVGGLAAGVFLLLLGLANVGSLVGIARVLRRLRSEPLDAEGEAALERHLAARGIAARALGGLTRRVRRPLHIYPVGLLMGLGFDTATQVALLVLAAGSAAAVLPWYAVLVLPVLFAAGMTLFDTADGVLMARAYGWALVRPVRKVFYNLATTALSVVVALGVGVVVLAGLAVDRLGLETGPLAALGRLDLDAVGYLVVGGSLALWLAAVALWRLGRFEERWSAAP